MAAGTDLVAAVTAQVVRTEMTRRLGAWDEREVALPPELPPVTLLAGRTYPRPVLERRLRFLRVMGWYPEDRLTVVSGIDPALPPEASIEDHVAAVYAAGAAVRSADDAVVAALTALNWALRTTEPAPPREAAQLAALTAFFDRQADLADPGWRERWPHDPVAASTWARAEATGLTGDRYFGRRRPGGWWTVLSDVVWRLAERKRRRWG